MMRKRMPYYRRPWVLYGAVVVIYAFLFLPIIDVVVNSFNNDATMASWGGFTTKWYSAAWSSSVVINAAKTSVEIAAIVTIVSAVLGTGTALAMSKSQRWRAR